MPRDIVHQSDFGSDFDLVYEMMVTGRKVGAGGDFYVALAHNADLFRRVVEMVRGITKEEGPLQATMQALTIAIEKGVQDENGIYRFFDPGIPLVTLRNLPVVRERQLMYPQDWYNSPDWVKREDAPQERTLRVPVEGSFDKTFSEQEKLLLPEEEVPSVRSVATFLVINALVTGKRLLPDCYVRCIDKDSDGDRVLVGHFDANGLYVYANWHDYRYSYLGVAASRKS